MSKYVTDIKCSNPNCDSILPPILYTDLPSWHYGFCEKCKSKGIYIKIKQIHEGIKIGESIYKPASPKLCKNELLSLKLFGGVVLQGEFDCTKCPFTTEKCDSMNTRLDSWKNQK